MSESLKKYLFPDHGTRVQAVRLTDAWQAGLTHQQYPACVQALLGELTVAATLLSANLKFDGTLVLQLQGNGPVALIVVECTSSLNIRASATLRENAIIPEDGNLQSLVNPDSQGQFIVVIDPRRSGDHLTPYQGVVPLEGDTVAAVLELYMRQSQQLDTRLWLAADHEQIGGLLLQRLPDHGGKEFKSESEEPSWEHACHLASTIKSEELLTLDPDTLVHRLFWEEQLLAFEPLPVQWHCPCSRERVSDMLRMLGQEEVSDILSERNSIEVACNFCGKPYHFDTVDCATLFTNQAAQASSSSNSVH